jgi:hypothetical protein
MVFKKGHHKLALIPPEPYKIATPHSHILLDQALSITTQKRINCCRLYLKVDHLSDICTLAGDTIDRNAWLGILPMPSSDADWTVQTRPDAESWRLWRNLLSKTACTNPLKNVVASRPGILTVPLGFWLPDSKPQTSPRWKVYFSHSSQRVYYPDPNQPLQYQQLSTPTRLAFSLALYDLRTVQHTIHANDIPSDAVPVQPTLSGHHLRVNRLNTPTIMEPEQPPRISSFQDHIDSLAEWKRDLLQGAFQADQLNSLAQHLLSGTPLLLWCSDGGAT